jgi:hypothetical protein
LLLQLRDLLANPVPDQGGIALDVLEVFENTIFGRFCQMRANSSSYSAANGFSSAVSQYVISS